MVHTVQKLNNLKDDYYHKVTLVCARKFINANQSKQASKIYILSIAMYGGQRLGKGINFLL